ncbi:hypothetical protein [Propioniferax innocua]|uniref:Uncharacterized protein n=1 Tax=Propioniferax innocua TaxID=1753 RepID=A0A542ZR15_9ACTN|nr:hypothetical protein [Propioniferax innocua]TQL62798.1 hypothetical protein FB460_0588 [Propioniferax innocua]
MSDATSPKSPLKPSGQKKPASPEADVLRAKLEGAVDFRGTAREALHDLRAAGSDAVAANQESLKGYDEMAARAMTAIEKELDKPDLTPEDRRELIDRMVSLVDRRDAKDTENKRFLVGLTEDRMKAALYVAGTVGMVAVAALAGPEGVKQLGKLAPQVAKKAITS